MSETGRVNDFRNPITPQASDVQPKLRVLGYCRVSTDRQADLGSGLDIQREAIEQWARQHRHRLVGIHADEGRSGGAGIDERIGLATAIDEIQAAGYDGLVVARLDRLARDLVLQEQILADLRRRSIRMFSATAGESDYLVDDPGDPSRALIRQVLGAVSQYERQMIRLRMLAGKQRKALAGRKAVGAYPFGYGAVGRGRERDAGPREDEQVALSRMLELRRAGASYRETASALDAEGFRPRRAARWAPATVRGIVQRNRQR